MCDMYKGQASYRRLTPSDYSEKIVNNELEKLPHVGNYCDAPIMVDTQAGELDIKLSFDYIGHFSKYIKPGAKRIGLSKYTADLEVTAFKNIDGTLVLVALNRTEKKLPVVIRLAGELIEFELPGSAIATALL